MGGEGVLGGRAGAKSTGPGSSVGDRAGISDDRLERQLEGWLRELEQKTTAQVKVLTVPSTDGEDVFGFVQRHAELWKLGRKGKDNGVLIVVVPKSPGQKGIVRIQPGYGFEATMPDSWCGSLARGIRDQYLKKNRYSEGIFAMTVTVANKAADAAKVTLGGMPRSRFGAHRGRRRAAGCGAGMLPLMILMIVFSSLSRRRRHRGRWGGGGMAPRGQRAQAPGAMVGGKRKVGGAIVQCQQTLDIVDRAAEDRSDIGTGGSNLPILLKIVRGTQAAIDSLDDMHGQSDSTDLVHDGTLNPLANPPGGIG